MLVFGRFVLVFLQDMRDIYDSKTQRSESDTYHELTVIIGTLGAALPNQTCFRLYPFPAMCPFPLTPGRQNPKPVLFK